MNRLILITLLVLFQGCSILPKSEIIDKPIEVDKIVCPEKPRINYPEPLILIPFKWDYPRDDNNNVILDSNVFIGLSENDYKIFLNNWNRLISREKTWKSIIDNENIFNSKNK